MMNMNMILQMMMKQNPAMQQALPFIQGKSPQELEMIARNLCKERGVDVDQALQQAQAMMRGMNLK